jgi:N-acetylneuraminic acid mutarotase
MQNNQLANKGSVDNLFTNKILKAGDTLTTPSTQTTAPTQDNHSIRKIDVSNRITQADNDPNNLTTTQIDNLLSAKILKSGDTIQGTLTYNTNYTADTNLVTKKTIDDFPIPTDRTSGSGAPVTTGTVIEYGSSTAPSGYLRLNGATVSTSTYSDLYKVIGDTCAPAVPGAGVPWQSQCGFNPSTQNDITGWTSTNSLVTATTSAASLVTKSYIYILGGYASGNYLDTIQRASFDNKGVLSSSWSNAGTLPVAMSDMGYVAAKGRFYLLGGYSDSNTLSSVYSAPINSDGTLGDFRTETSLPAARANPACFVIKNKLYVVSGYTNNSNVNTVYRTTVNNDGTLGSWETLSNFPTNFYYGKALFIKDKIYIFEVYEYENNSTATNIYYATFDSVGNIDRWTYVSNMPNNIYNSAIVCTDNYVFSIGGYDRNNGTYTADAYCAAISADGSIGTWHSITIGPLEADTAQIVIVGNNIYFIGGRSYDSNENAEKYLNFVYSAAFTSGITDYTPYYTDQSSASSTPSSPIKESAGIPWQSQCGFNPSTQNDITGWTSTNSLVTNTMYAASLVTKNYIYILGGEKASNSALDTIQRASFDNDGNLSSTWSNVGTLPVAMYAMGYVATKDRFYLIGGNNSSNPLSTVYSAPINADGALGAFRTETALPDARYPAACFVIKNKLYVAGGWNSNLTNTIYSTTINADGTLNNWTTLPNFPIGFIYGKPLLIKDRIYIIGVNNNANNSRVYYTTYDSDGNIGSWTYVGDMPYNISLSTVVCTDNYVFNIGGSGGSYTNATYRAPILTDGSIGTWTQISNAPVTATYAQSAIAGNKIYFIGGYSSNNSTYLNTVYSAAFTSGITDYTPYYTDQPNTSSTFYLPNYYSKEAANPGSYYYIKT